MEYFMDKVWKTIGLLAFGFACYLILPHFMPVMDTIGEASANLTMSTCIYAEDEDGYAEGINAVYATCRDLPNATAIDDGADNMQVGQVLTVAYHEYRSFLYFNTGASIPASHTIVSATLYLYGQADWSATDYYIVLQNGQPDHPSSPIIVVADYDRTNYADMGGYVSTAGWNLAGYNILYMSPAGLGWIVQQNTTSNITKLALRSSQDIAGVAPIGIDLVTIWTADSGDTTVTPKLCIEHRPPMDITQNALVKTFPILFFIVPFGFILLALVFLWKAKGES